MNKGYSGNSTKLDKYKQKKKRDLKIQSEKLTGERREKEEEEEKKREIRREIERSWRK